MTCYELDKAYLKALRDAVDLSSTDPNETKKAIVKCPFNECPVYVFATALAGRATKTGIEIHGSCTKNTSLV